MWWFYKTTTYLEIVKKVTRKTFIIVIDIIINIQIKKLILEEKI